MANPVFEVVRTVLAVREYQDRQVPDEVVARIVAAANLTASAVNLQPWHFVVVRDTKTLQELGGLVKTAPYIANAPLAIVVASEKASKFGQSDVSRAIQTMILVAWADGVGSNWTGFGGLDEVRDKVGLPDSYDVVAVLPFGYPTRELGKGKKKRKPIGEVASTEHFGTPFTQ